MGALGRDFRVGDLVLVKELITNWWVGGRGECEPKFPEDCIWQIHKLGKTGRAPNMWEDETAITLYAPPPGRLWTDFHKLRHVFREQLVPAPEMLILARAAEKAPTSAGKLSQARKEKAAKKKAAKEKRIKEFWKKQPVGPPTTEDVSIFRRIGYTH